jgi:hypothetical protein
LERRSGKNQLTSYLLAVWFISWITPVVLYTENFYQEAMWKFKNNRVGAVDDILNVLVGYFDYV